MFRKDSQLTPLEIRKKLLLAESELNRAELLKELEDLKGEIHRVSHHVRTIGSVASSAALLGTVVSIFQRRFSRAKDSNGHEKSPWLSAAVDGARVGVSLFLKIKSLFRERR